MLSLFPQDYGKKAPLEELETLLHFFPGETSPAKALMRALEEPTLWRRGANAGLAQVLQSPVMKLCARYVAYLFSLLLKIHDGNCWSEHSTLH